MTFRDRHFRVTQRQGEEHRAKVWDKGPSCTCQLWSEAWGGDVLAVGGGQETSQVPTLHNTNLYLQDLLLRVQVCECPAFLIKRQSKISTTLDLLPLTLKSTAEVY